MRVVETVRTTAPVQPRFSTAVILKSALGMFWARLGSLNALENASSSRFWREWLSGPVPSADTLGRSFVGTDTAALRQALCQVYSRLKRMKALEPPAHGLMLAVVDGHETTASRKRCCPECCHSMPSSVFFLRHLARQWLTVC